MLLGHLGLYLAQCLLLPMEAKALSALLNEPLLLGCPTRHCNQAYLGLFAAQAIFLRLFRLYGRPGLADGRYLHWHHTLQEHLEADPRYAPDVIRGHQG